MATSVADAGARDAPSSSHERRPDRAPAVHRPRADGRGPRRDTSGSGGRRVPRGGGCGEAPDRARCPAALPQTAPRAPRRVLADAGLSPVASHEGIERIRADGGAVADRLADLGCPRIVVPGIEREDRSTADGVRRFADDLNEFAGMAAERGLRLGYHNHDFEFEPLDGTTTWDILLDRLAPDVDLEIDVYWVAVGGRDPVTLIGQTSERVRTL